MFVLLLILWPIAELLVIIEVAQTIGVLLTILLLIAAWPLGGFVLRTQGAAAFRRLAVAVLEGRPPGRPVLDGALVVIGAFLLMIPGFITDVLALALLLPPTRAALRGLLARNLQSRIVVRAARMSRPGYDVEATATEIDPRTLPR